VYNAFPFAGSPFVAYPLFLPFLVRPFLLCFSVEYSIAPSQRNPD
jgi:hypothetical protein